MSMFLTQLIRIGENVNTPDDYRSVKVSHVLRITPEGDYISFDEEERKVLVPHIGRRANVLPKTLIDDFTYVFGTGKVGHSVDKATQRYDAYTQMLRLCPGKMAESILKFLDNPDRPLFIPFGSELTEEALETMLKTEARPGKASGTLMKKDVLTSDEKVRAAYACLVENARANHPGENPSVVAMSLAAKATVFIEVVGLEGSHLDPEVQQHHCDRVDADDLKGKPRVEPCSLCFEERAVARKFPSMKGYQLISFNHDAWCAYERKQGHNVPTCTSCVRKMTKGFGAVLEIKAHKIGLGDGSTTFLWWSEGLGQAPADLFDKIMSWETSDEDREEAISALPERSYIVLLEKGVGRAAVQRFHTIDGDGLRRRIRKWLRVMGPVEPWKVAEEMAIRRFDGEPFAPSDLVDSKAHLYLVLLAGEIPYEWRIRLVQKSILGRFPGHKERLTNRESPFPSTEARRRRLLSFLRNDDTYLYIEDTEDTMTDEDTTEIDEGGDTEFKEDPLPEPPDFYTWTERYHFILGLMLGRAASNQRSYGKTTVPFSESLKIACRGRRQAVEIIRRYSTFRMRTNGRSVDCDKIRDLNQRLWDIEMEHGRPSDRASFDDSEALYRGYHVYRKWDHEQYKRREAFRKAGEKATAAK